MMEIQFPHVIFITIKTCVSRMQCCMKLYTAVMVSILEKIFCVKQNWTNCVLIIQWFLWASKSVMDEDWTKIPSFTPRPTCYLPQDAYISTYLLLGQDDSNTVDDASKTIFFHENVSSTYYVFCVLFYGKITVVKSKNHAHEKQSYKIFKSP